MSFAIGMNTQSAMPTAAAGSFGTALGIVRQAAAAEANRDYMRAVDLYQGAANMLENLSASMKSRDPAMKDQVDKKATELFRRSQKLRKRIESSIDSGGTGFTLPVMDEVPEAKWVEKKVSDRTFNPKHMPPSVYQHDEEFTHVRYTPVCCAKPINFNGDGYTLRCKEMGRKVRYLVTVTMYNEHAQELKDTLSGERVCCLIFTLHMLVTYTGFFGPVLLCVSRPKTLAPLSVSFSFCHTVVGIANNVKYMSQNSPVTEKPDESMWHQLAVGVVSDGRTKANHGTLEYAVSEHACCTWVTVLNWH